MQKLSRLSIIVFILLSNINTKAQNGFIKHFDKFYDEYLATYKDKILFIKNAKNGTNEIKVYDGQMKLLEKKKVLATLFDPISEAYYGKPTDKFSMSDSIVYIDKTHFLGNGKGGYDINEISAYKFDDLTKPIHTVKFKCMPSYPQANAKQNARFYENFYENVICYKFYEDDRIYRIYRVNFKPIGKKESLQGVNNKNCENFYFVEFDKQLNVLKKGFLPSLLDEDEEYDERSFRFEIVNNHLIVDKVERIQTLSKHNEHKLYHISLDKEEFKVVNEIKFDNHFHVNLNYAISPNQKYLVGNSYYLNSKEDFSSFGITKYKGKAVFKYNLEQKEIEKIKLFPFEKGHEILAGRVFTIRPYFIGENIVVRLLKPSQKTFEGDSKMVSKISLNYATLTSDLEVKSEKEITYYDSYEDKLAHIESFYTYYDEKNQKLRFIMMNMPQKEKEATNVEPEKDGSRLIQVDYDNGNYKISYIPFPDDLKYLNRSKTNMIRHTRSKCFSLPVMNSNNGFGNASNYLVYKSLGNGDLSIVNMND